MNRLLLLTVLLSFTACTSIRCENYYQINGVEEYEINRKQAEDKKDDVSGGGIVRPNGFFSSGYL